MKKLRECMIRAAGKLMILSCLICIPLTASASELIYTIQTGSFLRSEDAQKQFFAITQEPKNRNLQDLRIEKIGKYYTVRIGIFKDWGTADDYLSNIVPPISTAVIKEAYVKDERIIKAYTGLSSEFELTYTVQTGSFMRSSDARKQFNSIVQNSGNRGLDYLRIEKIGDYHTVRIGKFDSRTDAEKYLRKKDLQVKKPLVTKAYIKEERIEEMYSGALLAEKGGTSATPSPEKSQPFDTIKNKTDEETEYLASVSPEDYEQIEAVNAVARVDEAATAPVTPPAGSGESSENEKPATAAETKYDAAVSPSVYDNAVERQALSDPVPAKSVPSYDEKPADKVDSGDRSIQTEVLPSGDQMSVQENVTPDSASEKAEIIDVAKPLVEAAGEQYAAEDATGEKSGAVETKGYNAGITDNHDLLEELGLDHVEEGEAVEYHFAEIDPKTELALGYCFTDAVDMESVFEYEDMKSYPMIYGDYEAFHYPHKFHFDVNVNSDDDYLTDIRYGYKQSVNAQVFNSTFVHNLEDIDLIDLDSTISSPSAINIDGDDDFRTRNGISTVNFKLKNPSYHGHAYYNGLFVTKTGTRQQRSLRGSGYFNNLERLSQSREIDQLTMQNTLGFNGHLGPAEFEVSHMEKSFNAGKDEVMFDDYTATVGRRAGNYPHNQLPELKSSSSTLKIHTSYTGKLVAAATFSLKERKNETSGASADVFVGDGSLRWMPLVRLSLFLNYSHRDLEADNPSSASITDSTGITTTYLTAVKPSVSTTRDNISIAARYRPEKGLTLKAKYGFENITRDDVELWNLKDSTRKNMFELSSDAKIMKGMKMNLNYSLRSVDKPSYNTEPYYSNRGIASITWIPISRVNLMLRYRIERASRTELGFSETDRAKERDVKIDNLFGSGTFQLRNNLSLSASYAYMRYEVKQDIVYEDLGNNETAESGIPFTDNAHVYSVSFNYKPVNGLDLFGNIIHTRTDGEFEPKSVNLTSPINIASFSSHKVRKTVYRASGSYACPKKFMCSVDLQYADVDDSLDNIYDSVEDADAYIILLRLMRKWGE